MVTQKVKVIFNVSELPEKTVLLELHSSFGIHHTSHGVHLPGLLHLNLMEFSHSTEDCSVDPKISISRVFLSFYL